MTHGRESCAYCAKENAETRDHIPPRSLFSRPGPSNLITVPCCNACRNGWSTDDEYFRLAVVLSTNAAEHRAGASVDEAVRRSLMKPTKRGFAAMVNSSLFEIALKNDGGGLLGVLGALKIDKNRFNRVAERIVRGLFYKERDYPVPAEYIVVNRWRQDGFREELKRLQPLLHKFAPARLIGDGVFAYTFAQCDEDRDSIVWLSMFFEGLPFIGMTVKPKHLRG